jgi:transposase
MMGQLAPAQNELYYDFNLEQHIPDNHLLRQIDKFLDFDQIKQHLQPYYSHTGRPSIDPELMLRMLLLGYCYGIRSERRLCEEVHFNLAYRWFCRLGLEDEVPDHSTFSKNRLGRFPESVLLRFVFENIVQRCIEEGMVKAESFAVDGSLIQADANRQQASSSPDDIDWGPAEHQSRPVRDYLESLNEYTGRRKPAGISLTDPAARWTAARGKAQFAYSTNYMVDVKCGVIVDVEASPGNRIEEVDSAKPMLERIESRHQLKPKRLMDDSAYGSAAMLGYLVNEKGIEPHIPVINKAERKDGTFSRFDFTFIEELGEYRCPRGKTLRAKGRVTSADTLIYRSMNKDCAACPDKPRCCPNTPFRKITHSIYESARDVARGINKSARFNAKSSWERKKVEMAFDHMKRNLNFHRLRLRGIKSANDECVLVATVQNLRKLARLCSQPPPKHRRDVP